MPNFRAASLLVSTILLALGLWILVSAKSHATTVDTTTTAQGLAAWEEVYSV